MSSTAVLDRIAVPEYTRATFIARAARREILDLMSIIGDCLERAIAPSTAWLLFESVTELSVVLVRLLSSHINFLFDSTDLRLSSQMKRVTASLSIMSSAAPLFTSPNVRK